MAVEVTAMATRNFGAPIRRNEDKRLLSGQALFVDDVELPGMVYAAFLRSNVAHAAIRSIDVAAARARAGVVAVYTAADLGAYWAPGPLLVPPPPIAGIVFNQRTQVPLAKEKIRHVGEPLAVVFAHSRYLAEDALSDIVLDVVCYRRHGHNETDEPAFTQPLMYRAIDALKTTRTLYAERLAAEGTVPAAESKAMWDEFAKTLEVDVGGGEFNVAYACARLGLRTGFISKLPDNPVARIILNHARSAGMDVSNVLLEKFDGVGRQGRVAGGQ